MILLNGWIFPIVQMVKLFVEGLLSTGPTPSSFDTFRVLSNFPRTVPATPGLLIITKEGVGYN